MDSSVANNDDDSRKRKAFSGNDDDTLTTTTTDHDGGEVNNINNDCSGGSSSLCCTCIHCHCGCHDNNAFTTTMAMGDDDAAYLDSLPTGYRFNPTDKELIKDYLLRKIMNKNLPKNKINEADIYGVHHPKDIVGNYLQAVEGEWYFFTSRNRKYPNGKRPKRKAGCGYWKATGPDTVINHNGTKIGGKKSLVYHEGNPPKGTKTDWMMHEYVVEGYERQRIDMNDMKLDDYVLCRIYVNKKRGNKIADEVDSDRCVASRDQDEKHTTNLQVITGQAHAHLQSNQDSSLGSLQVDDNTATQHSNQNWYADHLHHAEHNMPITGSDQHMSSSVGNGVNETERYNMFPNQQARPTILQVENNVVVQNYQDMSSLYGLMTSNVWPSYPVQMRMPPSMNHSSLTRFNQKYAMSNPSHLPTTPGRSPPLPPRIVNTPNGHGYPGMYWSGLNSNPQTPQTMLTAAFQEGNHCDGPVPVNKNIELMYTTQDDNGGLLHDNHNGLVFDGHEQ